MEEGILDTAGAKRRGVVKRVIFSSEESGYSVLAVEFKDGQEERVAGSLGGVNVGDEIEGTFKWYDHPRYGKQLKPVQVRIVQDTSSGAIAAWLAEHIKGVGEKIAERIMAAVGDKMSRLDNPDFLKGVKGVSEAMAADISKAWKERQEEIEEMGRLLELGFTNAQALKIIAVFGVGASNKLRQNPYMAVKVSGIGFKAVDQVGAKLGITGNDERRLRAAVEYVLDELATRSGHTAPRRTDFLNAADIVGLVPADLEHGLKLIGNELAIEEDRVGIKKYHLAEQTIREMASVQVTMIDDRFLDIAKKISGILTDEQVQVARLLAKHKIVMLTGGPGTGKSRTLIELVKAARSTMSVAVAAPTGKAAARLRAGGIDASTIHRLLGYDGVHYQHNEMDPLSYDLLVIDEASMIDVILMEHILRGIKKRTRLLMVGDVNQLPSVGPGQVFKDLMGAFVGVRLTKIFRQKEDSPIISAAQAINSGQLPSSLPIRPPDVEAIIQRAVDLWNQGAEVQVITPMNRGPLGVRGLNAEIKKRVNSPGSPRWTMFQLGGGGAVRLPGGDVAHVGDPLIGTVNNYDAGVMNGEVGVITRIEEDQVFLDFGDREVVINRAKDTLPGMALAYAITVHRSQGSEWDNVIFVLDRSHYVMANREIVYTAITRAKSTLEIYGDRQILGIAAKRRGSVRQTWLNHWASREGGSI